MSIKRGLGDNTRRASPASPQKLCKDSSCQMIPKRSKSLHSQEEDHDEETKINPSPSKEQGLKKTHQAQIKSNSSYRVAQRPGDDDDEDNEDDDTDEEDEEEELSSEKIAKYVLKYGLNALICEKGLQKKGVKNQKSLRTTHQFKQKSAKDKKEDEKKETQTRKFLAKKR